MKVDNEIKLTVRLLCSSGEGVLVCLVHAPALGKLSTWPRSGQDERETPICYYDENGLPFRVGKCQWLVLVLD